MQSLNGPKFTHDYPKTHIAHARRMRKSPTDAERKLWGLLKTEPFRWRRQQPVGKYIVDFYCAAKKVIVEVDGGQHCGSPLDQERDAWLSEQGYQVIRFWNNDVQKNFDGVASVIRER